MNSICLNGEILPAGSPALMVSNKSYRYGDGLFETIKLKSSKILLEDFHFERLFSSLAVLDYKVPAFFTPEKLKKQILDLCMINQCDRRARVRLSVARGNGSLSDDENNLQYAIECWPLDETVEQLNETGFTIDIYPDARKSCDKFSNIKSASHLPYVMAARYAKKNKLDDCLVLNMHDRIADASIANIFLIKNGVLFTPSLHEGCVSGVMRRWLIQRYQAEEAVVTIDDLLSADELFLTNAIYCIRWIKQFRDKFYTSAVASKIHQELLKETGS